MAYYATYQQDETGALQKVVINAGVGFCLPFYGETAPPGTLACDGSEISREAYKELFQVLGTKAGAGDGSTTFNLPDLRGQFVRGTGGNAAALGVEQGDAIRNLYAEIAHMRSVQTYTAAPTGGVPLHWISKETRTVEEGATATPAATTTLGSGRFFYYDLRLDASQAVPTAAENRPTNVALLWCIIYE